jgi:hypothetical protein
MLGDVIIFGRAVRGRHFKMDIIARWFNQLVSKDEYEKKDKKSIIANILYLTSLSEDNEKSIQNAS